MDLLLVPTDPEVPIGAAHDLLGRLRAEGVLRGEGESSEAGLPGPAADRWCAGFAAVRLEDPGAITLFSNTLGGFRVTCPSTGASIAPAFAAALTRSRDGGPLSLRCPSCGQEHALDPSGPMPVVFSPPAAFGRFAVRTVDVADVALTPEAERWVEGSLGPTRVVLSRMGWR